MSRTESQPASVFYADNLLPLRMANARQRLNYLDQDSARPSFWADTATRTGGYARVDPSQTDVAGLLKALGDYWNKRGETRLLQLLPDLMDLHHRLTENAPPPDEKSGHVVDYMYPMF